MNKSRVLAFHAEALHDDRVWMHVLRVSEWMASNKMQTVFFVYPFRAHVVDRDITNRVQVLASLGHEIGQHTHFYAGKKVTKPDKADDFSDGNIVHCLHRDFRVLLEIGYRPKGFTAGGWFVNTMVWKTLVELGFTYDCSARVPLAGATRCPSYARWRSSPEIYVEGQCERAIVCLPTTCTLSEWFKWGYKLSEQGNRDYELVCLHDYDLLHLHYRVLLWWFLRRARSHVLEPASLVARRYTLQEEKRHEFGHCKQI